MRYHCLKNVRLFISRIDRFLVVNTSYNSMLLLQGGQVNLCAQIKETTAPKNIMYLFMQKLWKYSPSRYRFLECFFTQVPTFSKIWFLNIVCSCHGSEWELSLQKAHIGWSTPHIHSSHTSGLCITLLSWWVVFMSSIIDLSRKIRHVGIPVFQT